MVSLCVSLITLNYNKKMLKKLHFFDVVTVRTPYDPLIHFKKNKESSISQTEYAKIIWSVMFLKLNMLK